MAFTPLILAGGKSTRMRSPKHLLTMPDGRPLYQHQIDLLRRACPESPIIYLSLAQDSQLDDYLQKKHDATSTNSHEPRPSPSSPTGPKLELIYDLDPNETDQSAGPAAGLLAAFRSQPQTTWLVVACDYPLLTVEALERLCRAYEPPVTCYRNRDGFCEPLVGIWGPEALRRLSENVKKKGRSGPSAVVRELGGKQIEMPAGCERWLVNVNTKEEWEAALAMLDGGANTKN
ncbi:hypothetical protein VTK56DRAFT_6060 [Thermocarpiscus australiensis]